MSRRTPQGAKDTAPKVPARHHARALTRDLIEALPLERLEFRLHPSGSRRESYPLLGIRHEVTVLA